MPCSAILRYGLAFCPEKNVRVYPCRLVPGFPFNSMNWYRMVLLTKPSSLITTEWLLNSVELEPRGRQAFSWKGVMVVVCRGRWEERNQMTDFVREVAFTQFRWVDLKKQNCC